VTGRQLVLRDRELLALPVREYADEQAGDLPRGRRVAEREVLEPRSVGAILEVLSDRRLAGSPGAAEFLRI